MTDQFIITASTPGLVQFIDISGVNLTDPSNSITGLVTKTIDVGPLCAAAAFGTTLCVGNRDGTIRLWDAKTEVHLLEIPSQGSCDRVVLLFDNPSYVISGSADGAIRMLDTSSGACRRTMTGHVGQISCLARHESSLASGGTSDQSIRVWDIVTGSCLKVLEMHGEGTPTRFTFDPTGHHLAAAISGGERIADIWNLTQGSLVATCRYHTRSITQMANHRGNLVTSSADGSICAWSWSTGSLLRILEDERLQEVPSTEGLARIRPIFNACPMPGTPIKGIRGFCYSGDTLITGGLDGALRIWNDCTGQVVDKRHNTASVERIFFFKSNGNIAVTYTSLGKYDRLIELWDLKDLEAVIQ